MHRRPLGRGRRLAALAAVIMIVGCLLPWWQFGGAAGDKPVAIDRPISYAAVAVVGWIGLVVRAIDLATKGALALPDRAPGLWLVALGLIVLSRAVYDLARESSAR